MQQEGTNQSTNTMNSISFHQKSTGLSLIITSSATIYYFVNIWSMQPSAVTNNVIPAGYGRLVLTTLILFILAQIVLQVVLAFGAGSAPAATAHEKAAALKATRNAYGVLTFTIFAAVASFFWSELTLFHSADLLIIGFALAEIVRFASQLFYARQ